MQKEHVCIVGAGLCGTLLAIRLAQRGYRVTLCEKRADMRKHLTDAGRSINLALSDRGFKALRMVGLEEKVRDQVIPMHGRYIHPTEGSPWLSPYSGRDSEFINSVSRPGLNMTLLDKAEEYDNIFMLFDHTCSKIDMDKGMVHLKGHGYNEEVIHADIIIGTDGAGSAVRQSLMDRGSELRFSFSVDFLDHGYKELEIPADATGEWRIEKNALHIWPRQEFMLIALPNLDGSFTVTLFFPFDGDPGFNQLDSDARIEAFFQEVFPSAKQHMPDLINDFHDNPTSSLGTVRCYPWQYGGKLLLMGDAAHAVVPFYGQGMNCAMEDVYVLDELIDIHGGDWDAILNGYQQTRKKDADAIADLAIANYYEMRDHVDNINFKKKRQLEMLLESTYPEYSSKYNLVTFNENVPYSIAKEQGDKQDQFLLDYCSRIESIEDVNLEDLLNSLKAAI